MSDHRPTIYVKDPNSPLSKFLTEMFPGAKVLTAEEAQETPSEGIGRKRPRHRQSRRGDPVLTMPCLMTMLID